MRIEKIGNITFILGDCMDFLKATPAGAFDLAICDPPYGINRADVSFAKQWKQHKRRAWDKERPNKEYFKELNKVSKNQIIWGANYFTEFLPPSMGWIVWDKGQKLTMSDSELAYTSFERALRNVVIGRGLIAQFGGSIHATQKPVKLYKWLLKNYAKEGDKILDTHGGSGSIAIACYVLGFELTIIEKDKEIYNDMLKRFKLQAAQKQLF